MSDDFQKQISQLPIKMKRHLATPYRIGKAPKCARETPGSCVTASQCDVDEMTSTWK